MTWTPAPLHFASVPGGRVRSSMQERSALIRGAREQLAELQAACAAHLSARDGAAGAADNATFTRDYEQRVQSLRAILLALDAASSGGDAASPPELLAKLDSLRQDVVALNARLFALATDMMDVERAVDMASALPDL